MGKIEIKEIYGEKPESSAKEEYVERKIVQNASFGLTGFSILADRFIYINGDQGLVIQNRAIVSVIRNFLKALWERSS